MRTSGHAKVRQSLADFWERQRFRALQRKLRQGAYYASQFPVHGVKRRSLALDRDIYPATRSPEGYTRFRRVERTASVTEGKLAGLGEEDPQ